MTTIYDDYGTLELHEMRKLHGMLTIYAPETQEREQLKERVLRDLEIEICWRENGLDKN